MPPPSFASWLSALSLAVLSIVGFVVFANTRIHTSTSSLPSKNSTVVEVVSFTNATQLAQVCASACLGGACEQSEITGITSCTSCGTGSGATIDPVTRVCVDTSECIHWSWCSLVEGRQVTTVHNSLALKAFFGPYPMNYTYPFPVARYDELQEFVPQLAATQTAVAALLDIYVSGRLALGGGDANTAVYFVDEGGYWGNSLVVYRAALPDSYASYIQTLKTKICTRTWQPAQGTCAIP